MISLMPNKSLAIKLRRAERMQLEKWGSSYGPPQQVALRCRIILGALAGQDNVWIAEHLGVSRPTVQLWRRRGPAPGHWGGWVIAAPRRREPPRGPAPPGQDIPSTPSKTTQRHT